MKNILTLFIHVHVGVFFTALRVVHYYFNLLQIALIKYVLKAHSFMKRQQIVINNLSIIPNNNLFKSLKEL